MNLILWLDYPKEYTHRAINENPKVFYDFEGSFFAKANIDSEIEWRSFVK